ncbi:hypothetical protein ILUMI_13727, partial [Ignelater luminosus]
SSRFLNKRNHVQHRQLLTSFTFPGTTRILKMQQIGFSWFDFVLFIITIGLSAAIGIYFGFFKKQNTTKDYLHGGKKMKVFPVAMSLAASSVSGVALIGVPAEIYLFGTQFSIMVISIIIMGFIVNFIYLPVFHKLQIVSIFEYLELRFDKKVRSSTSVLYVVASMIGLPLIVYAPSLALNHVTGFNLHVTALFMSLLCIFYTSIGGVKAVVWTDTLQFTITLTTFFCVLVMGTISAGGLSVIWERAREGDRLEFFNMDLDPTTRSTFWSVMIGNLFLWTLYVGVSQGTLQRFLAVPTYRDSQKVLIVLIAFTIITKLIGSFSGLIVYAKYYDCDPYTAGLMKNPDQIIPFYVMDVATQLPGLGGLFVAGLFTTALSTLSTLLNALSGIIYKDLVDPFMPATTSERKASNIMKLITLIIGLLGTGLIFIVERLGTILEILLTVTGIIGGPVLGLFTMGVLLPTVNTKGALTGVFSSIACMLFIAGGHQRLVWNGIIKTVFKSLETYGCNITFNATINSIATQNVTMSSQEEPFWLFKISFYYYVFMGTIISMVIGQIVSWIFRSKDDQPVSADFLSPCIHRFLSKSAFETRYCSVEKEMLKVEER